MPTLNIKPTHRAIKEYYESLQQLSLLHVTHELAIRDAFQQLLSYYAKQVKWTLVPEFPFTKTQRHSSERLPFVGLFIILFVVSFCYHGLTIRIML